MQPSRKSSYTLADPAASLAAILEAGDARAGRTIIAHLDLESQELLGVRTIDTPTPIPGHDGPSRDARWEALSTLRDQLREIAEDLVPIPEVWCAPYLTGELYTVVCREGRVVDTLTEWQFLNAWRISNQNTPAISADTYVVTPHGWTGALDRRAGLEPRLAQVRHRHRTGGGWRPYQR